MSSAAVLACDGCGATAVQTGYGKDRALYPAGWLRLSVTGRPTGGANSTNLARVDVCSPGCAPRALEQHADRVAPGDPEPPA